MQHLSTTTVPEFKARYQILNDIQNIASSIKEQLNAIRKDWPVAPSVIPLDLDHSIPELTFPSPHDILAPISTLPVSHSGRQKLLKYLNSRILELQKHYNSMYMRASHAAFHSSLVDVTSVHKVYQALYRKDGLTTIQSWVNFIIEQVAQRSRPTIVERKPHFNHHFTPVFEEYFQLNGYPSPSHRAILAQRSDMTPRQIEVWFQNHRRRSRNEGKIIQRLDSEVPLKRALALLSPSQSVEHVQSPPRVAYNQRPIMTPLIATNVDANIEINKGDNISNHHHHYHKLSSCLEENDATNEADKFRPPHAYPTKRTDEYPDPFPNDNGVFKFPQPVWRRKPSTIPIIPIAVDMDDFARQFHMRLNFVNNSWKREGTPTKSEASSVIPWFAPLRTVPVAAPIPALQRRRTLAASSTSMLTSTIAKDPLTFVFPIPGELEQQEESNLSCIIRLPVGPRQSASSITERIDRSVDALDRDRKGFRRSFNSLNFSPSCLDSPGEIAGRKGTTTSRRAPSGLQTLGSRTSSFASDTSSSSDDSSSPSTPPLLPSNSLHKDAMVASDNFVADFDSFFNVPSSPSFDFTFSSTPTTDTPPLSPQPFNLSFTSPTKRNAQPLSSRTFNFTFSNPVAHRQPSALFPNHTPLIIA